MTAGPELAASADGLVAYDSGFQNLYTSEYTGGNDELHVTNSMGSRRPTWEALNGLALSGIIVGTTLYTTDGSNVMSYTVSPTSVTYLNTVAITGNFPIDGDFVTALAGTCSRAILGRSRMHRRRGDRSDPRAASPWPRSSVIRRNGSPAKSPGRRTCRHAPAEP